MVKKSVPNRGAQGVLTRVATPSFKFSLSLDSAKFWDIRTPVPSNSSKSKLTVVHKKRKRRISVEVHKNKPVFLPPKTEIDGHDITSGKDALGNPHPLGDGDQMSYDVAYIRILVPVKHNKILAGTKQVGIEVVTGTKVVGKGVFTGTKVVGKGIFSGTKLVGKGLVSGTRGIAGKKRWKGKEEETSTASATKSVSPFRIEHFRRKNSTEQELKVLSEENEEEVNEESLIKLLTSLDTNNEDHLEDDSSVNSNEGDEDDDSVDSYLPPPDLSAMSVVPTSERWTPKYKLKLQDITIHSRDKVVVSISTVYQSKKQLRKLFFYNESDAENFVSFVKEQQGQEKERIAKQFDVALGEIKLKESITDKLRFLIEIVGAEDLSVADIKTSDPYVSVYVGDKLVHKTIRIKKDLNPIWTVFTKSLFILTVTAQELFTSDKGLSFRISDYDKGSADDVLGIIYIPAKFIYSATGERVTVPIQPFIEGYEEPRYGDGTLSIRCRHATDKDLIFMEKYDAFHEKKAKKASGFATETAPAAKGGVPLIKNLLKLNTKKEVVNGKESKLRRVRPCSDPDQNKSATDWLTEKEIEEQSMKPSKFWIDKGTGEMGTVHLEILGCDNLPNLDTGLFGNKTDAFVEAVYEDCTCRTDIIDDCLSPRWMPWSNRAFIFNIMHSSSQLFLGIFDCDNGLEGHDLIGNVSVDLSSFRPGSEYLLDYDIYTTALISERHVKGTLKIRLKMNIYDERAFLLSALRPPPMIYLNCHHKKDYHVIQYTCKGSYDMNVIKTKTIFQYLEELATYKHVLIYILNGLENLILWRGHRLMTVRLPCKRKNEQDSVEFDSAWERVIYLLENYSKDETFLVPLYSIISFVSLTVLVEQPRLIPSFCFAVIGCLLAIVGDFRAENPNPWFRSKSFQEIFFQLLTGQSYHPHNIATAENEELAKEFDEKWKKRYTDVEEAVIHAVEKKMKEYEEEQEEIGDTDVGIETENGKKMNKLSINPITPYLGPIQDSLSLAVFSCRFIKNVITWEECYFSFWIVMACFLLSFVFMFVPLSFFIKWSARIFVWVLFGPWMKLVDIYVVSPMVNMSKSMILVKEEQSNTKRMEKLEDRATQARILREDAKKLKDMTQFIFGDYITRVPVLKMNRYRDTPLSSSSAKPLEGHHLTMAELAMVEAGHNRIREDGQQLVGNMIPEIQGKKNNIPTGKPINSNNRSILSSTEFLAGLQCDSQLVALAKLGTLFILTGVGTWYVVKALPVMYQGKSQIQEL